MLRVGCISTFPPTQCGLATYAEDLIRAAQENSSTCYFERIPVLQNKFEIPTFPYIRCDAKPDYVAVAEYINARFDVVDLQHEFKIFGKPNGEHVQLLLENIGKPITTTLHSVATGQNAVREKMLAELVYKSKTLFVFSDYAKKYLAEVFKGAISKTVTIPHGVPTVTRRKERQASTAFPVFVSAGHMRDAKGYETALLALHSLRKELPNFRYVILGANHPQNESSRAYRRDLLQLIEELCLIKQVTFIDEYLERQKLIELLTIADIGLLPYPRQEQSSSGILALMIACGLPIVSTPFQFAISRISSKSGILSDSFTADGFAIAIMKLMESRGTWEDMSRHNQSLGRDWNWQHIAKYYCSAYQASLRDFV